MLTKLLKYEFRSTWKAIGAMNLFILLLTAVGSLFFITNMMNSPFEQISVITALCLGFYYLSIAGVSFAVYILIAVRFYKNLYTDEGYLMHTLPVKPGQLLLSKTITATIYSIITETFIVCSVLILFTVWFSHADSTVSQDFYSKLNAILLEFQLINLPYTITISALTIMISTVFSVLMTYGAITIGQLFPKRKVMSSILCYIGITIIIQIITSIIIFPIAGISLFATAYSTVVVFNTMMTAMLVLSLVMSFVLYYLCLHLMKRNLNLD